MNPTIETPKTSNGRCAHEDDGNGRCRYCVRPMPTAETISRGKLIGAKDWVGYLAEKSGHRLQQQFSCRGQLYVGTCARCGAEISARVDIGRPVKEWTITGLAQCIQNNRRK